MRKHLSLGLGLFSEYRDINIRRIGDLVIKNTNNRCIAICAPIAPYTATRRAIREVIVSFDAFTAVHVDTSVEERERSDHQSLF